MQLPRGTFREIRKKVVLQDTLSELEKTRFSGTCGIVAGPATGSFVFREGTCILAKFRGETGAAGIRAMLGSALDAVDVILSTLDETQIKLALEFNPGCRVRKETSFASPGSKAPEPVITHKTVVIHPAKSGVPPSGRPGKRPVISAEASIPQQPAGSGRVAPRVLTHPPKEEQHMAKPSTPAPGEKDDFEDDIYALDTMDLDLVTSRIRSDCKNLVRQLDLEHLIK
ncbi:MAG TPA: hypothetical protein VHN82_04790, partial [Methanoregula sp.]|nr:hypothetical protein [Methanoregula sp.]